MKCGCNPRCLLFIERKDKNASFRRAFRGCFLVRERFQRFRQARAGKSVSTRKERKKVGYESAKRCTYSFSRGSSNTSMTCSTRLFAVRSSLPTVTRIGSCWNVLASLRTASGHVALTVEATNVWVTDRSSGQRTYTSLSADQLLALYRR